MLLILEWLIEGSKLLDYSTVHHFLYANNVTSRVVRSAILRTVKIFLQHTKNRTVYCTVWSDYSIRSIAMVSPLCALSVLFIGPSHFLPVVRNIAETGTISR